jgi:hypothetical protein
MKSLKVTVIAALMGFALGAIAQEATTKQEVDPSDLLQGKGTFEKWQVIQTNNKEGAHFLNAMKNGWSFTPGKKEGTVLIPDILSQLSETAPDKEAVVRKSDKFHTGEASLELKGSFYISPEGGIPTKDSDVYNITFYVYGDNPKSPMVHATVVGDNSPRYSIESHDVEDVEDGKWAKVTEMLKVIGSGAKRISFRIGSNNLMLMDDLTITKQEK